MNLKNTKETYGIISKFFHWSTALIIFALIVVGLYMVSLPYSPDKLEIYALHKSFGLLVLWLVGLRIIWKFLTVSPQPHPKHAFWEKFLAKIAHIFLYIAMIGMPLSGWLMSSAGEYPVPFFGIQMPDLVEKNTDLAKLMNQIHAVLAYLLIAAIGLHALGALKHHFIDQDSTLTRMMAKPMAKIGPYVLIIVLGLFAVGVVSLGSTEKLLPKKEKAQESKKIEKTEVEVKISNPYQWQIVKEQSRLNFRASVYGKEFIGIFNSFDGVITFNPDDLSNAKADIIIDMTDIDSGDTERDTQIKTDEWFDVAQYPTAQFRAADFEVKSDNNYVAIGELTIKNRSTPLILPFQLDIVETEGERRAYMNGSVKLNRLDYGLGEDRWEAADSVGPEVAVDIKLVVEAQ